MANDLLVLVHRLAMLDGPYRCQLLGGKRSSIHGEEVDVVLLQKLVHRLPSMPHGAPHRRSSSIGQDQPRVRPTDQVDTAGQLIEDRLEQSPPGLGLSMHTSF